MSQRQASRSVAGPAPPPSWRSVASGVPIATPVSPVNPPHVLEPVTTDHLRQTSSLSSRPPYHPTKRGPARLVEFCLYTVLRYLDDDEDVQLVGSEGNGEEANHHRVWTRGELLREQAAYLESPLKSALMDMGSLQPEGSPLRLSDESLKAILGYSGSESSVFYPHDRSEEWDGTSSKSVESWETADTTLHHLPLTLHPSPHSFLRLTPWLQSLSLTSLDLAYSTIPVELEKLVSVIPASLRELGLVGVRVRKGKTGGEEEWRRGLGVLARRLIVLRVGVGLKSEGYSSLAIDAGFIISSLSFVGSYLVHSATSAKRQAPFVEDTRPAWSQTLIKSGST